MNGCAYCVDLHARLAREAGEHDRRLLALVVWREAPLFDARERAALALAEALTDLTRGPVAEEVWEEAARRLTEQDLAALLVTITGINAWNRVMIAAGEAPPPIVHGADRAGRPPRSSPDVRPPRRRSGATGRTRWRSALAERDPARLRGGRLRHRDLQDPVADAGGDVLLPHAGR